MDDGMDLFIAACQKLYPMVDWQAVYDEQGKEGLKDTLNWYRQVTGVQE